MFLLQEYMRSERDCGRYRTCSGVEVRGGAERNTGARYYWAVVNASGADDDCSEPTYHLHDGNVASMPGYELSVRRKLEGLQCTHSCTAQSRSVYVIFQHSIQPGIAHCIGFTVTSPCLSLCEY
jgi:hypothetical protein